MPDFAGHGNCGDEWTEIGDLLELATSRPAFHADAACREAPAGVSWFPSTGQHPNAAKAVCGRCLVMAECQAWAMAQGDDLDGIWAGLSRPDRSALRRKTAA